MMPRRSKRLQEKASKVQSSVTFTFDDGAKPALDVLPYDVWYHHFLPLVKTPMDRFQVMNTCKLFQDMLRPTMTTWLFPEILPHILQYLPKQQVLKCRQVCKVWRNGFDQLIENQVTPRAVDHGPTGRQDTLARLARSSYSPTFRLDAPVHQPPNSWMNIFQDLLQHPQNPIIGRTITFTLPLIVNLPDNAGANYWRRAKRVLIGLGTHLWHVEFDGGLRRAEFNEVELYAKFQACLKKIPNLKSLRITKFPRCHWVISHQQLQAALRQHPLPKLRQLTTLILMPHQEMPDFIQNALIIKYLSQLQSLRCKWNRELPTILGQKKAQELRELAVDRIPPWELCLINITRFLHSSLSLQRLSLNITQTEGFGPFGSDGEMGWRMDLFLGALARFPQLEYLQLTYPNQFVWTNCLSPDLAQISIPSLKHLAIMEIQGIAYDFLQCFPNLETIQAKKLDTKNYGCRMDFMSAKIQITKHLYMNSIAKSNIWQILKKLQVFRFKWVQQPYMDAEYWYYNEMEETSGQLIRNTVCTRKKWEKCQRQKLPRA